MVSLHFYQFGLTSFHIFVLWLWPWLWPWLWLLLWLWPECWAHFIWCHIIPFVLLLMPRHSDGFPFIPINLISFHFNSLRCGCDLGCGCCGCCGCCCGFGLHDGLKVGGATFCCAQTDNEWAISRQAAPSKQAAGQTNNEQTIKESFSCKQPPTSRQPVSETVNWQPQSCPPNLPLSALHSLRPPLSHLALWFALLIAPLCFLLSSH